MGRGSTSVKQNPKTKKIGWIPRLILIALAGYTCVVLITLRPKITEARERVDEWTRKVELKKEENELLKANDPSALTDDIIANIVRDKMGYVLPGERIFKNESDK